MDSQTGMLGAADAESRPEPTYGELFDVAMEAREDGEYAVACDIFRELMLRDPEDRGVICQLMDTLVRAGQVSEADGLIAAAVERFPDDIGFARIWCELPDMVGDWDQSVARRRSVLEAHAGWDKPDFLPFILGQALPLFEWRRWDDARALVDAAWPLILQTGKHPGGVLYALENLGMYGRMQQFCARVLRDMDRGELVQEHLNLSNYQYIAETAEENSAWMKQAADGVRVLSVGQNCLPYTVSLRWGLTTAAEGDDPLTPFALGAFGQDTSAAVLADDFAPLLDRSAFYEAVDPASRAPIMCHRPSGAPFFHDRGRASIGPDQELFHRRLAQQIGNFRQACESRGVVFVYALVGAGTIDPLIESLERFLARGNARLLVLNHTRQAVPFQAHPCVTCEELVFLDEYSWNIASDFTSDRGMAFELRVMRAIKAEIKRCLRQVPQPEAATHADDRAIPGPPVKTGFPIRLAEIFRRR
jgi:hypothetical protein